MMWPLYAVAIIAAELVAATGLGRFLSRREPAADDIAALADVVTAALVEEKAREHTLLGDAAWLAVLDQELEIEKARAYLAAIETGDDLIWCLGGDK